MPRRLLAFLVALTLCCTAFAAAPSEYALLFGSESCADCAAFRQNWQENAGEDDPVLVYVCIDENANYAFLKSLEKAVGEEKPATAFPVFFVAGEFLKSTEEFWEKAGELLEHSVPSSPLPILSGVRQAVESLPERARYAVWNAPSISQSSMTNDSSPSVGALPALPPRLLFVTSPGCQKCGRQQRELQLLAERLPELRVDEAEFTTEEGQAMMRRVVRHFGIASADENLTPLLAWGSGYATGRLVVADELADILRRETATVWWNAEISDQERSETAEHEQGVLKRLTLTMTIGAGLLDGINPCAFATIIFLVSYLLYLKRRRRFVLAVGVFFCLGVFLSYLLYGISLGMLVDFLNRVRMVKMSIYGLFCLAGMLLAVLHFRDAVRFRRTGRVSDMEMGLDAKTHNRIHDKIHRWSRLSGWLAVPAAALLGCVVSAMELACTGQVYLPTIAAVMSTGFHWTAFRMLLLYNVAFILPLLAVTIAAYCGTGAKGLADLAKRHIFATKLAMAFLFLLMAVLMAFLALRG